MGLGRGRDLGWGSEIENPEGFEEMMAEDNVPPGDPTLGEIARQA